MICITWSIFREILKERITKDLHKGKEIRKQHIFITM